VKYVTSPTVPAGSDTPLTREERRRRTEATILDAARQLFAEVGFEKTTIRGVAGRAGVDPALVMQYYGSKEGLFAAAAHAMADRKQVSEVPREQIASQALKDLFGGFEDEHSRCASIAVMRSCLTHERARAVMRDEVMSEKQAKVAQTIGGDDAELRAGLLAATMIGTTIARYLLEIPSVAQASQEDVERVMEPVLKALVEPS
jgi:AcrR family transcriptional regulator